MPDNERAPKQRPESDHPEQIRSEFLDTPDPRFAIDLLLQFQLWKILHVLPFLLIVRLHQFLTGRATHRPVSLYD